MRLFGSKKEQNNKAECRCKSGLIGKSMRLLLKSCFLSALVLLPFEAKALTITSIYGDMDNFGTNAPGGTPLRLVDISHEPDDGLTDRYAPTFNFSWSHNYAPITSSIINATLTITTFDMEDNGAGDGLGGAPYDDRLYLNGVEIAGAFDDVSTPDGTISTYFTPNTSTFNLGPGFFTALQGGLLNVNLLASGGTRADYIAIDYARLDIETPDATSVPEPSTFFLLGGGLGGFVFMRRVGGVNKVKSR